MNTNTKKIVDVLNNRNVRRVTIDEETIKCIEEIMSRSGNQPIKMVGYWGVGEKKDSTKYDQMAIDNLSKIMELTHGKIKVCLILADEHGRLNGYQNNDTYLTRISKIAQEKDIDTVYLSSIYKEIGLSESEFTNVSDSIWSKFPECYRCILEKRASKHQKKCLASEDAKRYLYMTQVEKQKISAVFPNCIWFTYGDIKNLKDLFPKPVISIWPHKRGKSELPWFSG